ncbi:MAG: TetR family transcriptional regulator [Pseudomonadales bacterium]
MSNAPIATPWHEPKQERGRQRFEAILESVTTLIVQHGCSQLKMRDIAQLADIPIGSLYQYFPDRNAILARLHTRYFEHSEQLMRVRYSRVDTIEDFFSASEKLIKEVQEFLSSIPSLKEVWIAVQSKPEIRHLDIESSRRSAQVLKQTLRPLVKPSVSEKDLATACFLITDLFGRASLIALDSSKKESAQLMKQFAIMFSSYVRTMVSTN